MKRNKFVKYLEKNGCTFVREGSSHTLYRNISNSRMSTVPRHSDIRRTFVIRYAKTLAFPIS